ncbi:hypothetical protein ACFL5Z_08895 [Planctomycetota bacterium]
MEPIAAYEEKTFRTKKTITLYPDRINVTGKILLQQDFKFELSLRNINPVYQQISVRDSSFWAGIIMSVISAIVLEALRSIWQVPWSNLILVLMLGFVVTGIILCLATIRKVEFYTFTNLSATPVLSIAKSKKDRNSFDAFISHLVTSIKETQDISEHQGVVDAATRCD